MGIKPQSLAGQGQALCSLLPLPRGPCDNPLSGIFHAETVAQRGPWERCEGRHHPSLPPGTGLPLLGVLGPLFSVTPALRVGHGLFAQGHPPPAQGLVVGQGSGARSRWRALPGAAAPADSGCTLTCNMPTGEGRTQRVPSLPSARPCPEGVEQARLSSEALSHLPSAGNLTLRTLSLCRLRFLHSTGLPPERKAGGGRSLKSSFSFTQELPKYLRGFHKCSREDAIHLAGLIYKARFGDDRPQLASIPKILRELVPENLTRLMSPEEWKKVLVGGWGGGPWLLPL